VAALFAAFAVHAQNTGTQTAPAQSTPAAGQTSSGTGSTASLSRADRKLIVDMAMANMAEIESARMAQTKTQNEQIKNFAQQMIDDHTRGVTVPTELDRMHKAKEDHMAALSGDAFDRAYMAQAGVADHKKVHDKLRQAQMRAKDPEVKALVARTLPIVDQHLNSAEQLHKSPQVGSSRTQGTTESSGDKPKTDKH
jgi:putative membrane protein